MSDVVAAVRCPSERMRNICILAHVDHGKTTCADNLISSNGIISRHSAGKIRYLDSRQDEQERQITMKSSSIALKYAPAGKPAYVVNLIDSPGHVDFTSEVSTAARLADGALVVVDVLEGVEAQTRTVLRQARRDRVKTVLFLNKIDRLFVELDLSPLEAYQRLVRLLENINAINQQLISEEIMDNAAAEDAEQAPAKQSADGGDGIDLTSASALEFDMATEEAWRYSPERGNVAFGSAYHGWAFRIDTFAKLIASKMGAKPESLQKVLWGSWTYSPKAKRATRIAADDTKTKPMFVQFILEQIWKAYDATYKAVDPEHLAKMKAQIPACGGLDVARLVAGQAAVRDVFSRWLPFADAVLDMATEHLPSPPEANRGRMPVLCPRWFAADSTTIARVLPGVLPEVAEGLLTGASDAPTVAYLAKFLAADLERLTLTGDALVGDEDVQFVGICRVFSGTLRPGDELFVCVAGEGDSCTSSTGSRAPVRGARSLRAERVFYLKGTFMEETSEAPSGSIVAVQVRDAAADAGEAVSELGVERFLTLCSVADGPCFETPYSTQAFSIVRVNIEPQKVTDSDALYRGLRLLHRADPSVTVEARSTGENVLGCCGDEHLKRCITDLQKLYARGVPLSISPPLVAIRESIAASIESGRFDPKASPMWLPGWASHITDASTDASSHVSNEHEDGSTAAEAEKFERVSMSAAGVASVWTANRKACIRVSAVAVPVDVLEWLDANVEELETVVHRQRASPAFALGGEATLTGCLQEISRQLSQRLADHGLDFAGGAAQAPTPAVCGVSVARGSRTLLVDTTGSGWALWERDLPGDAAAAQAASNADGADGVPRWMRSSLVSGFRLASISGPLSEEPMRGVVFVVHACRVANVVIAPTTAPGDAAFAGSTGVLAASTASGYPAQGAAAAPLAATTLAAAAEPYGPMSGQVMVATKEACRCCLFRRGFARICEAMLRLEVQTEQEMLGKVYGVLGKRRCQVLEEGLREGTSLFYIHSNLPLADSFGLAHDLRAAASGQVSFHCAFSHWERSEEDPFQEATLTAEEVEDLGDQPLPPNTARKLIDGIRKRKGLPTDEKVVLFATKQRTVTRNK